MTQWGDLLVIEISLKLQQKILGFFRLMKENNNDKTFFVFDRTNVLDRSKKKNQEARWLRKDYLKWYPRSEKQKFTY